MWLKKRKARKLIEAASGVTDRDELSPETRRLLEAVEVLRESDSAETREQVDGSFAAGLRERLLSGYPEATSREEETGRRKSLKWLWVAAPVAAAAVLIVVLLFVLPGGEVAAPVANLEVLRGSAVVKTAEGITLDVVETADIGPGDRITTRRDSLAVLDWENGTITRMDSMTEVSPTSGDEGRAALEQFGGRTYSRVAKGHPYEVTCGEVAVTASGTAFEVDTEAGTVVALAYQGDVTVKAGKDIREKVNEGDRATVSIGPDGYRVETSAIDLASLDRSWLAFNRDLDELLDFPLGILSELDGQPSTEDTEVGVPVQPQDNGAPDTQPSPQPPSPEPQPQPPGPQPQPPGPQPQPPGPSPAPEAGLDILDKLPPVLLGWKVENLEFDRVSVLRADGAAEPVYPWNEIDSIPKPVPPEGNTYKDKGSVSGKVYTYRLAFLLRGNPVLYSNKVTVDVPPPEIKLQGELIQGLLLSIKLRWNLKGKVNADGWAVCRSSDNASPTYPAAPGDLAWVLPFEGDDGTYLDDGLKPEYPYYYRIAILVDGLPIQYSNVYQYKP